MTQNREIKVQLNLSFLFIIIDFYGSLYKSVQRKDTTAPPHGNVAKYIRKQNKIQFYIWGYKKFDLHEHLLILIHLHK